ncbi:MAG: Ditrans,polycis-undecaprenyl-diphosphate synthase ((2E,6E)-farnesyl-diphosphate specific) [Bryobacteraceae bacterium]|nr:Ditrans,polycis-undecaprenyl-diphosphate synthase ((2E,6E)-farnesyl-diphosphate specific) [Bryobacteraceae bacterium]
MQDLFAVLTPGDEEWQLAQSIDPAKIPGHVAIIMDGNGRWAKMRSLPRIAGHRAGIEPVRTVVETCARLGVECLTLYAFSVENWKRPRSEVDTLWRLLRYYLKAELPRLMRNNIRLTVIGRVESLPVAAQAELEAAVERTARNTGLRVNLAINYGGRTELADAMNRILEEARGKGTLQKLSVDEEMISANLYTGGQPDPDLLIRTSGEMRISNFLLWQIAYAELYVTETYWPDFKRIDFLKAVVEYQKRDRRFGGLTNGASRPAEWMDEPLGVPAP